MKKNVKSNVKSDPEFDAVVIGSGAGGAASTWGLTERGLKVLLLEAGPAYDPYRDYHLHESIWEKKTFPHKVPITDRQTYGAFQPLLEADADLRSWRATGGRYNHGDRRQVGRYSHVVGLGGSTLHFTGEAHRMNAGSMKMASRFGVAADWPVSYDQLEPYYVQAEHLIGVAGPAQSHGRPRSASLPLPPHELSFASQTLGKGLKKAGHRWQPNTLAALSRPYDGRPACNYCGNCNRGCPRTDKGSVDVTLIPKAIATGRCTVATECTVTRLIAGKSDRISGVEYIDQSGRQQLVTAPIIVVACGAVETPRLLLNSAGGPAPEGIANESGEVGRNFMETLFWTSSAMHPDNVGSHRGLPADAICWDFNDPDAIDGVVGGCRFSPGTAEANLLGPMNYALRVVPGWGREHKIRMREMFGHVLALSAVGESLPNPRAFIELDPDAADAIGLPKARINSYLTGEDMKRLRFMAAKSRALLAASGAGELVEEYGSYDTFNSSHVFGTCRMGNDTETSVVDGHCRSHRWRNLYITDASVFPSSGGGEAPALTIIALALRAAASMGRA